MICREPLTQAQMRRSQKNYICYSAVNGVSYMCLGETVIVLLAVRMNMPDWCVSIIGSLLFFGYLMMPLGKWMTSRVGAAKTQANCWVCRNCAALVVASGVVFHHFGMDRVAMACLLGGAFFFYAFRAAGVVMSVPLVGDISDDATRGRLFAVSNSCFFVANAVTIVALTGIMNLTDSVWMLFAIVVFGAGCGITASGFLRRIDETEALMKHAAKPLWEDIRKIMRDRTILRMIAARFALNLLCMMAGGISMLTVKRGYGISDGQALIFVLSQYMASSLMSPAFSRLAAKIGPRRTVLVAFMHSGLIITLWCLAPKEYHIIWPLVIFFVVGSTTIAAWNSVGPYFLLAVPEEKRTSTSVCASVFDGALAGLCAMCIAPLLLRLGAHLAAGEPGILRYRIYYMLTIPFFVAGFFVVRLMVPLSDEKRHRLTAYRRWIMMQIRSHRQA